jgi:hypothetical protein
MATSLGNVSCQPYWLKTPDFYDVDHERLHHNEAIFAYGEYSFFILMWGITDFQAGSVQRCPYCIERGNETETIIAQTYRQPALALCEYCYGTTFYKLSAPQLGGIKARIVRPCMWNATDEYHKRVPQGEMITSTSEVQTISDFRMRTGDYIFKADGTRWRVEPHETDTLISGLQAANDINAMIGYKYPNCIRQDEATAAYIIPPVTASTLVEILDISVVPSYPVCFETWEVYNAENLVEDDYTPGTPGQPM